MRYVSPDGDWAESRVEYDMDDEDEEWLEQHNGQVSIPAMLSKNFVGPIPSSPFPSAPSQSHDCYAANQTDN